MFWWIINKASYNKLFRKGDLNDVNKTRKYYDNESLLRIISKFNCLLNKKWTYCWRRKEKLREKIEDIDEKNEKITGDIDKLEKEIESLIKSDEKERNEEMEKHRQEVSVKEDQIKMLKGEIKNKWEIISKQIG